MAENFFNYVFSSHRVLTHTPSLSFHLFLSFSRYANDPLGAAHGASRRAIEFELEQGPRAPGCVANPSKPVDPVYVHSSGAILMAVVAGIVFNVPYATLCVNRIFTPLGMVRRLFHVLWIPILYFLLTICYHRFILAIGQHDRFR